MEARMNARGRGGIANRKPAQARRLECRTPWIMALTAQPSGPSAAQPPGLAAAQPPKGPGRVAASAGAGGIAQRRRVSGNP
jgi:hypothetical protein